MLLIQADCEHNHNSPLVQQPRHHSSSSESVCDNISPASKSISSYEFDYEFPPGKQPFSAVVSGLSENDIMHGFRRALHHLWPKLQHFKNQVLEKLSSLDERLSVISDTFNRARYPTTRKITIVLHNISTVVEHVLNHQTVCTSYSNTFYTGFNNSGYKMCVQMEVTPKTNESSDLQLTLSLVMMASKEDCQLSWPFNKEVNIKLLNEDECQDESVQVLPNPWDVSFHRPRTKLEPLNEPWVLMQFSYYSDLEQGGFICDDALKIELSI